MVNLIPLRNYLNYKKENSVDIYIGLDQNPSDKAFLLYKGSQPNDVAMEIWNASARSKEDWEVFKAQYLYDLQQSTPGKRFIKMLEYLDALGKRVNVVCTCTDAGRCIRSVIAKELEGRAEVNLE